MCVFWDFFICFVLGVFFFLPDCGSRVNTGCRAYTWKFHEEFGEIVAHHGARS